MSGQTDDLSIAATLKTTDLNLGSFENAYTAFDSIVGFHKRQDSSQPLPLICVNSNGNWAALVANWLSLVKIGSVRLAHSW
jgi:hypothetical protein